MTKRTMADALQAAAEPKPAAKKTIPSRRGKRAWVRAASMTLVDRTPAAPASRMSPCTAPCLAFFAATAASRREEGLASRLEKAARELPCSALSLQRGTRPFRCRQRTPVPSNPSAPQWT